MTRLDFCLIISFFFFPLNICHLPYIFVKEPCSESSINCLAVSRGNKNHVGPKRMSIIKHEIPLYWASVHESTRELVQFILQFKLKHSLFSFSCSLLFPPGNSSVIFFSLASQVCGFFPTNNMTAHRQ